MLRKEVSPGSADRSKVNLLPEPKLRRSTAFLALTDTVWNEGGVSQIKAPGSAEWEIKTDKVFPFLLLREISFIGIQPIQSAVQVSGSAEHEEFTCIIGFF